MIVQRQFPVEPKDKVGGTDIRNSSALPLGSFLTVGCYLCDLQEGTHWPHFIRGQ